MIIQKKEFQIKPINYFLLQFLTIFTPVGNVGKFPDEGILADFPKMAEGDLPKFPLLGTFLRTRAGEAGRVFNSPEIAEFVTIEGVK